jgi:hypothetical protein
VVPMLRHGGKTLLVHEHGRQQGERGDSPHRRGLGSWRT